MEKSKDKTDHYLTGSDTKPITVSDTTQNVDIGEELNSRSIDHVPLFKLITIMNIKKYKREHKESKGIEKVFKFKGIAGSLTLSLIFFRIFFIFTN